MNIQDTILNAMIEDLQSKLDVSRTYTPTHNIMLKLLFTSGWGPLLLNFGYHPFKGWLQFLNSFTSLSKSQARLVKESVKLLGLRSGHKVLDIACGRGQSTFLIGQMVPDLHIVGVDLLPENIEVAERVFGETPNRKYKVQDAMNLESFSSDMWDRAICIEAAFHFPDREKFLAAVQRVLRPSGKLVIVDFVWRQDAALIDNHSIQHVRDMWQWNDLFTKQQYDQYAIQVGLQLTKMHNWTNRVTRPIQSMFDKVVRLHKTRHGRKLLQRIRPFLAAFSDDDWKELEVAADSHRVALQHIDYVAMEFKVV